ncbi:3'(2'),5'-bisphosphate nucleotidase [Fonticula alba]|uniref:3'(2'),5'-bisphosphate nucleotidase n=1 Tax=Fonticula alba TaxID=691883 RepID=A0A058Z2H5_FONAL|nr:3'(2'),5'-bisphosphate nucleotidase [Fonticula alba]KCV68341.1 3'(2'),5'-bisphosphate nucleotidase [Fonticula alba]|eukprot:XP_009497395.1 3'(2'),5'-bisphosphate nucleotidase [Fonticula alba]
MGWHGTTTDTRRLATPQTREREPSSPPSIFSPFLPFPTMSVSLALEREAAIKAVAAASRLCQGVFKKLIADAASRDSATQTKADQSPVTVADYGAQAVMCALIARDFPNDLIVGEEDSKDLASDEAQPMRTLLLDLVNTVLEPKITESELLAFIDRGNHTGGSTGRFWTMDPIDGTKGFLRGEQFAVCLALVDEGQVRLGVMGCPNLPLGDGSGQLGTMQVAVAGQGAFELPLFPADGAQVTERQIHAAAPAGTPLRFVESVEAAHSDHSDSGRVAKMLDITADPVRMDSQAKYASVARGDAAIYLRLPTRAGYEEKIWDHASGRLIVAEAGGQVTDVRGHALDFGQGRTLKNNIGVIATSSPELQEKTVAAVMEVLKPKNLW